MKSFYGGVFVDKNTLELAGVKHPIKLEYYKRINEEKILELNQAKYGISIVKTEYEKNETKIEEKDIRYLTNDEKRANFMLEILKQNCVTPIELDEVVSDFSKQIL